MRVGTNISAITANNVLNRTDKALTKSMERLSSGMKVNHAKDNPAGIAIAKRMNSQISGLSLAGDNAADAISVIQTADGALSEIHAILQRMSELAMDASNGTKTDADRETIDAEIKQLKDEITRISGTTDFNGQKLLDGSYDLRGYTSDTNVKVAYYSDEVPIGHYTLDSIVTTKDPTTGKVISVDSVTPGADFSKYSPLDIKTDGDMVTISGVDGFEMILQARGDATSVDLDMTGIGAMRMQIGANEGQVLAIRIPEVSLRMTGLTNLSVGTQQDALKGMQNISDAINYISQIRARLGAYQNRLESTAANLDVSEENMTSSYSKIMDVDMAEEMTQYTTQQVLIQAGTNMLAQANERPQQVLQLLQ